MTTAIEKVALGIQRYTHFLMPKSTALDDLEGSFVHCAVCTVFCYLFIVSHSNYFYTENNYRMLNLTQPRFFFGLYDTIEEINVETISYSPYRKPKTIITKESLGIGKQAASRGFVEIARLLLITDLMLDC